MNFVDPIFLLAFPVFIVIYWALSKNGKCAWLLFCSYVFYGWTSPEFCLLLLCSTLVDYGLAKAMEDRPTQRKVWLSLSLLFNLGVLIGFKYLVFL